MINKWDAEDSWLNNFEIQVRNSLENRTNSFSNQEKLKILRHSLLDATMCFELFIHDIDVLVKQHKEIPYEQFIKTLEHLISVQLKHMKTN